MHKPTPKESYSFTRQPFRQCNQIHSSVLTLHPTPDAAGSHHNMTSERTVHLNHSHRHTNKKWIPKTTSNLPTDSLLPQLTQKVLHYSSMTPSHNTQKYKFP